jgi:hypothetical protein
LSVNNPSFDTPNGHGSCQYSKTLIRSFYETRVCVLILIRRRHSCHVTVPVSMSRAPWPENKQHVRKGICGVGERVVPREEGDEWECGYCEAHVPGSEQPSKFSVTRVIMKIPPIGEMGVSTPAARGDCPNPGEGEAQRHTVSHRTTSRLF